VDLFSLPAPLVQFLQGEGALILPQIQLTLFALGILLTDFLLDEEHKHWNAIVALVGVVISGYALYRLHDVRAAGFADTILVDPFFVFFGFLFLASAALVILLSARYLALEAEHNGEYYALVLFATVGMMFMASAIDLVVLFISLETMAITFYVLAGYLRSNRKSNEGALKYMLLGAFSSGLLAYGFSLLYGLSGSTGLFAVREALLRTQPDNVLVLVALVTVLAGLLFKVAAVPFHQWAPDTYEGAPTTITAFLSVASKTASFAMLLRIFLFVFWSLRPQWEWMLAAVAIATMTWGNFAALTQNNLKRLLAYSSIAHAGYVLLGLVAGNETGFRGISFYLFAYTFMNTGAFAIIILLRRKGLIGDEIEDVNGLYYRNPAAALLLLLFMLSLAGIPPTAGFLGKYFIFLALIEAKKYTLAVVAVIYVVPALYYYFRIVQAAWMRDSNDPVSPALSLGQGTTLAVTGFVTLAAGLYPEPFIRFASYSVYFFSR
jgi:NADH-quinone oxidoreductase subunit N